MPERDSHGGIYFSRRDLLQTVGVLLLAGALPPLPAVAQAPQLGIERRPDGTLAINYVGERSLVSLHFPLGEADISTGRASYSFKPDAFGVEPELRVNIADRGGGFVYSSTISVQDSEILITASVTGDSTHRIRARTAFINPSDQHTALIVYEGWMFKQVLWDGTELTTELEPDEPIQFSPLKPNIPTYSLNRWAISTKTT